MSKLSETNVHSEFNKTKGEHSEQAAFCVCFASLSYSFSQRK